MNLRDVFGEGPDVDVTDLAFDNRAVVPGSLFFCVPGFTRDGHDFAPDAVARGAVALVVARPLALEVPQVLVADVREAMAVAAARFQGDPTARLRVAGITGTNGKTTTAFLLRHLLEAGGVQTGLLGTVTSIVGGVEHPVKHTTPEAIDLQRTFADMLAGGDAACAMEVSSHALELHRASAIHWAVAVFTNLTQDHLDFHPDMESYFLAKRRLFEACEGPLVVNVDDAYGARLAAEFPSALTFSIPEDARFDAAGATFTFRGRAVRMPLPGRFNVSNAMGALLAAEALGVPLDVGVAALASAARVPGRFEPVDAGQSFSVLVDYAHTPDSLENVLRAAREIIPPTHGRVICVFGAGGDRDRGKRPLMGEIAARLADVAIVTSDNPRSEDPEAILDEIEAGMTGSWERFVDRRAAIARAVELAAPGDVVVIAGKGHEQGQEFAGGRREPFDDRVVAAEALR
ncbi:MAG: UDP-N-acetylmuramoyl-L-alanyl-D-glutamate--2,6-diaminopimelate ligase [Solirubrobacteraceae bacterium]|jgi:UDP-N-acetylmuramoyl-L-alanyl-D-glutamate--2,6-diaminopimelate ligase|nr:UDP-N-acetylmuramoyl-L-alanyl-D-glutamate--2,6-diaminopimelate ligase [Solirubrobacteraceae bacterium]